MNYKLSNDSSINCRIANVTGRHLFDVCMTKQSTALLQFYSAVVGSMIVVTSLTALAGNPPWFACSRTISSFGAM